MSLGTWSDLIRDALLEIGVKSSGESLDADEQADALRRLRAMLEEWAMEGLLVPGWYQVSHDVEDENSVYTMGPADHDPVPDIAVARSFEEIYVLDYRRAGQSYARPLKQTGYLVLAANRRPDGQNPTLFAWDRSHPVARLVFDARTTAGDEFTITGRSHIGTFEVGDDFTALMPGGYREAVMLNLAVKLSSSYGVKGGLSMTTRMAALKAKRTLKKRNVGPLAARLDPALETHRTAFIRGRGTYWL